MKKTVLSETDTTDRPLDENHLTESPTSKTTYVWTCFNGIKLFVPYISITNFPKKGPSPTLPSRRR